MRAGEILGLALLRLQQIYLRIKRALGSVK